MVVFGIGIEVAFGTITAQDSMVGEGYPQVACLLVVDSMDVDKSCS